MKQPTERARVTEVLPNAQYKIALNNGSEVLAYVAGKMKLNKIKVLVGDIVDVIIDPYGGKCTNRITRRV